MTDGAEQPDGALSVLDGEPDADELARRRAARSVADRVEDGEDPQLEMPLNLPGASRPKSGLRVKRVVLEGKLAGSSVKQLGGEITDPDQLVELRVLARLDKNIEVPVRDATDESGTTESVTKRQVFRPIRIEVLNAAAPADSQAAEG